jgi:hypothetical protein
MFKFLHQLHTHAVAVVDVYAIPARAEILSRAGFNKDSNFIFYSFRAWQQQQQQQREKERERERDRERGKKMLRENWTEKCSNLNRAATLLFLSSGDLQFLTQKN